jgi:hypothetical protein
MGALLDLRDDARRAAPSVPLVPELAASARATWHARMVNEFSSNVVFEDLARQMERAGFDAEARRACVTFAAEERRHGVLCGAVVEALGGEARAMLPDPKPVPWHHDVPAREGVLRNLVSVCCMSETVAVALIGAERIEMPEGELRRLLTSIWADEVGHARFGWRLLHDTAPSLDADARARLGAYMAVAFAHLETHELAHLPLECAPPPEGASLGLCSGADARVLFYETVRDVIVPGLEAVGLPGRAAWLARRATPATQRRS